MTNFEKYKADLLKIEGRFAIDKAQRRVVECSADGLEECIDCKDCLFNDTQYCWESDKIKWLCEEYEPPVLSDDELGLIKSINKLKKRKYRFIVRLGIYKVGLFIDKPNYYSHSGSYASQKDYIIISEVDENIFPNITFDEGIYDIENKIFIKVE